MRLVIARSDPAGRESDEAISSFKHQNVKDIAKMMKQYYIYIMTNKNNTVLYTGVANNLKKRIYEHKSKMVEGFTKKYNVNKLLYYEICDDSYNAIVREKQIKAGARKKKEELINRMNSEWKDLFEEI